jgi:putative ABC transport system substrate-binding protein
MTHLGPKALLFVAMHGPRQDLLYLVRDQFWPWVCPMRRRQFISLLSGAAAWPLAARAQQSDRIPRIGALMSASESDAGYQSLLATFRDELKKLGWEEGRNIRIDFRWRTVDEESRQRLAKELVALQPDLMLGQSTPTTAALLQQTSTIPIVFFSVGDPVGEGFVAGLSRPGRNVTGFINMEASMSGKWLELLKDITPNIRRVAILFNPATAPRGGSYYFDPFKAAGQSLGLETVAALVHDTSELESVIASQASKPNTGLVVMSDVFPLVHRTEINHDIGGPLPSSHCLSVPRVRPSWGAFVLWK